MSEWAYMKKDLKSFSPDVPETWCSHKEKDPTRERKEGSCELIGFAFVCERRGHNFSEFFSILKWVKRSSGPAVWDTTQERRKNKEKENPNRLGSRRRGV